MENSSDKIKRINEWYCKELNQEPAPLLPQKNPERINQIEKLIGEPLPNEIRSFYEKFDGNEFDGNGFMGSSILDLELIISELNLIKSFIKPKTPTIPKPAEADKIINNIIEIIVKIANKKKFGLVKTKWHKIEFDCGEFSFGGPYIYKNSGSSDTNRQILDIPDRIQEEIRPHVLKLYRLEEKDYKWDTMEFEVFANGEKKIKRSFDDNSEWLNEIILYPKRAIKRKFPFTKWVPIFSDGCGNFIGIDLDPDTKGVKGQVIKFGRDEEEFVVIANSWTNFLDFTLEVIEKGGQEFLTEWHLHANYQNLIMPD